MQLSLFSKFTHIRKHIVSIPWMIFTWNITHRAYLKCAFDMITCNGQKLECALGWLTGWLAALFHELFCYLCLLYVSESECVSCIFHLLHFQIHSQILCPFGVWCWVMLMLLLQLNVIHCVWAHTFFKWTKGIAYIGHYCSNETKKLYRICVLHSKWNCVPFDDQVFHR